MFSSIPETNLLLDLYELTMAQTYFRHRLGAQATFDLFVRTLPFNRSYFIFTGLEEILRYLKNLRFSIGDLDYLDRLGFSQDFLTYLGKMRFYAEVWAMPEGTIFFPGEPVMRVTGPLIETQIIESFLLNVINLSTMIATKASRIVQAAKDKRVYDFSLRRTHGIDAALKAARSSYIAGFSGTSNVLAAKLYDIPAVGTMAHSFVMSFSSEDEAFRAFFETFPQKCILLVDTYDTEEGITRAISAAREFSTKGYSLKGIRLDSGNLVLLSKMARRMLDAAGLWDVKILASGDLDEYAIKRLLAQSAPIDEFGVGTKMGTSSDAPFLDVIYKMSEVTNSEGEFMPTMKLSEKKATLPGRKQVFRVYDKKGRCKKDIIGLEKEDLGEPLLKKVMRAGELFYKPLPVCKVRDTALKNLKSLNKKLFSLEGNHFYLVLLSRELKKMVEDLSKTSRFSKKS